MLAGLISTGTVKARRYSQNIQCQKNLKELHTLFTLYFQENYSFNCDLTENNSDKILDEINSVDKSLNSCPVMQDRPLSEYLLWIPTIEKMKDKKSVLFKGETRILFSDRFNGIHGNFSNAILNTGKVLRIPDIKTTILSTSGQSNGEMKINLSDLTVVVDSSNQQTSQNYIYLTTEGYLYWKNS